ncbi:hypothetical protein HHL21_14800 [Massilia sp. RP-1-19]|uniref:Resolvase/invertase-type recombinase catalytic domain-containing protein n=1 Tax=Massilia polaris TaxID=2728846 RepID=A0A848HM81_9BURK|nr:hypothetical protein [Massilia polaris]
MERDLIVERTQAGLARAKAEGKTLGRPPKNDVRATQGDDRWLREQAEREFPGEALRRLTRDRAYHCEAESRS